MAIPELTRPDPDREEAEQIRRFWYEHHGALLREYPEQFVAVKDGVVVASHVDLARLVAVLADMGLDPRRDVIVDYITNATDHLLL